MTEAPKPSKVVFRIPQTATLAALLLAVAATPFAFGLPGLQLVYLVPVAVVVWVLRNRTTADASGLVAHTTFGRTAVPWGELRSLRLGKRGTVAAVRADESEVRLPAVRLRHLPVLSLVSGGVVPDPATAAERSTAEPAPGPAPEPSGERGADQE